MPKSKREIILESALKDARETLRRLANDAGDVPEWNRGGYAYKACRKIDRLTRPVERNQTRSLNCPRSRLSSMPTPLPTHPVEI